MEISSQDILDQLEDKIKVLIEKPWKDGEIRISDVRLWYKQFTSSEDIDKSEQIQFLYLLSKFMYIGRKEIEYLLMSLYRDFVKYPVIREIRRGNGGTFDIEFLNEEYEKRLKGMRFLGIGNPSESGSFLLYRFRQVNGIPKNLFIGQSEIFQNEKTVNEDGRNVAIMSISDQDVTDYIFIDDLTCSGSQAFKYSRQTVSLIKSLNPNARVHYLVLVATKAAKLFLREKTQFDSIDSVYTLDETFKCFESESRYYDENPQYNRISTKAACKAIDKTLEEDGYCLGFDNSQLLLSFEHNTPDNVPPIFWSEGSFDKKWTPIFRRYHKIYS